MQSYNFFQVLTHMKVEARACYLCLLIGRSSRRGRLEMDGGGKVTRRNPTGRAPVGTGQGSRGASRVSRGASRGGRSHSVSDGHVNTEDETYWSYEDSTYQPETEPVETPYEGDDDDMSDEDGENDSLARIETLL
ncbi:unnamed protein product [Cuscuta europaea]|uniref:Uncharacterized protein n=1 Tax=Cuscuta europaea TaxID=41803 RepID=A0A9P1EMC3_CUSEU|nr:unnamed protein product [Cuscuta europaea]